MKTKCGNSGCSRMLLKYEYCKEHEVRPCVESGCKRKRRKDGKCNIHCGYKISRKRAGVIRNKNKCKSPGCDRRPYKYTYCDKHGKRVCSVSECNNVRKSGELCSKHAYYMVKRRKCIIEDCKTYITDGHKCKTHSMSPLLCSIDSCKEESVLEDRCIDHIDFSTIDEINFWMDNL